LKDRTESTLNQSSSNIQRKFTFAQLREQNRTTIDLYKWYAPIDLIEQYDLYLESNDEQLSQTYFSQCKSSTSGSNCQYQFNSASHFAEIVMEHFDMKYDTINYTNDILTQTKNGTCYTHLKCTYILPSLCLD
jgi:hypothetical protein